MRLPCAFSKFTGNGKSSMIKLLIPPLKTDKGQEETIPSSGHKPDKEEETS